MRSILVANPKGGCGKTTIATNLAAAFANAGFATGIADIDRQKSSLDWIDRRDEELSLIVGIDWTKEIKKPKRKFDRLVIDAPAALKAKDFQAILKMADAIILPLLPSTFDQVAAMAFLGKIESLKPIRKNRKPVAVVANRARTRSRAARTLNDFLTSFNHAPVATIREAVAYTDAAETGMSIFDKRDKAARLLQEDWQPLIDYVS